MRNSLSALRSLRGFFASAAVIDAVLAVVILVICAVLYPAQLGSIVPYVLGLLTMAVVFAWLARAVNR